MARHLEWLEGRHSKGRRRAFGRAEGGRAAEGIERWGWSRDTVTVTEVALERPKGHRWNAERMAEGTPLEVLRCRH